MITIVASDLDGTLLTPEHKVADFTKKTLNKLHQQNLTFIFATGRHHIDVGNIRSDVGIPAYMITSNGARVHDADDNLIYSKNVPETLVPQVIDLLKNDDQLTIHMYSDTQWFINAEDESLKEFHDNGFTYTVFDVNNPPVDDIAKVFVTMPEHEYLVQYEEQLKAQFGDQLMVAFSTPWCLEIMAAEVSKGAALEAVAKLLGKTLENCIAFGDGMNDYEMLSMASKGIVMGTSHEKVKKALPNNEVIGSSADEAVAHYLENLLLK
ncbi:Cof-type HAD-IIB family hydrolase [Aliivibrio fischeri]|uniref:Cof-type HAD-IIB family hydrolase n=1 Tax=Aliivibrio fischeri TaxID=668 RepID=UPI001F4779A9|nr:Cof-type HAD-IIB family hydrolase [Aliivibrio fischeri]MCE7537594.1 Cof-type HAD-IIB family hydrolase [Aliivibrio fischeri]MCE7560222.1 Cof-type HAD-IIB family hydrolase [Aliivibrio fischeri]